jgi:hypothetical protein
VPGFVNYKKGAPDLQPQAYQLHAYGRWFSPGTLASSTTKTGRQDITEILLKVVLNTINQIKSNHMHCLLSIYNPISKTIIVKIQTR